MLYYLLLLAAGALQGVMVSLNGQLGKYYSLFAICFFVHGIALILLRPYYMRQITSRPDSDLSTTIKLGVTTGLVGVLVGAVAVLSVI